MPTQTSQELPYSRRLQSNSPEFPDGGDKKATSSRSKELAGVPQAKAEAASVPPGQLAHCLVAPQLIILP